MSIKQTNYKHLADTIIDNLKKRQIDGYYFETAKEAVEKAYPQGVSTAEVLVSFIDEHTTSSYNWKKLEKAMEVDPVLEAIGKMFIETTPVKVSYRYKFY